MANFKHSDRRHHRMRLVIFLSVRQRELVKRMCDGEEVTVMEATRTFPIIQIKRLREVGFWITANPEKHKNITVGNHETIEMEA